MSWVFLCVGGIFRVGRSLFAAACNLQKRRAFFELGGLSSELGVCSFWSASLMKNRFPFFESASFFNVGVPASE